MKNLLVGVGLSTKKDSSEATKEALDKALKSLNNKKPTITYVFFTDKHDAYKVNDTLKNNFAKDKEIKTETLSKYELMRAEDLAKTKYNTIMLPSGTLLRNRGACYVEREN